jgi:hypothetical protein
MSSGWLASTSTLNRRCSRIDTEVARLSWILVRRGGAVETITSAEPEGVTLQGTVPTMESLYLPGLLDTSIHRTNTVRFSISSGS